MRGRVAAALIVTALIGWIPPVGASPLSYGWSRTIGTSLADVTTDGTGFTVVTGELQVDEYGGFLVAAYDRYGKKLWQDSWKPIRNEPAATAGEAVTIGPDGNVYAVGFGWHCRFGCESGGWFIRAYTRDGTLRWTHQAAGWRTRPRQSKATGIDAWSGGVVITGYEYDDDVGATVSWLRAYELDGTFDWTTPVRVPAATEVRVATEDVAVGPSGAIFVAGHIMVGPVEEIGQNDLEPFIAGFTADGVRRWTDVIRERGDLDDDHAVALDVRGTAVVVAGESWRHVPGDPTPPKRGWLSRISLRGDVRWTTTWGGDRTTEAADVAVRPDGKVVAIGSSGGGPSSAALVLRTFDRRGEPLSRDVIDPSLGGLRGTAVAVDALGASLVGIRQIRGSPGSDGRLWRM